MTSPAPSAAPEGVLAQVGTLGIRESVPPSSTRVCPRPAAPGTCPQGVSVARVPHPRVPTGEWLDGPEMRPPALRSGMGGERDRGGGGRPGDSFACFPPPPPHSELVLSPLSEKHLVQVRLRGIDATCAHEHSHTPPQRRVGNPHALAGGRGGCGCTTGQGASLPQCQWPVPKRVTQSSGLLGLFPF